VRCAVILAGGAGTRLWPLSRESFPKQLIPVVEGRSLLEEAWLRLEGLVPVERRLVCTAEKFRTAVASRVPALTGERFIGEPEGRDTLAAVTLSCALAAARDPSAVVAILTADQVITPAAALRDALASGFELVESDPRLLVTFGVQPTHAATGFGYLELGEALPGSARAGSAARRVARYREKPPVAEAERFVAAGPARYLWNSGMFLWKASRFLELAERHAPDVVAALRPVAAAEGTPRFAALLADAYRALRKISVDYGFMEPVSRDPEAVIAAVPLTVQWADIGSWPAFAGLLGQDAQGNAASGTVLFSGSRGTTAVSSVEGHLVACLGCEDLVVIHTADATLVCPRARADEVKALLPLIAEQKGKSYL
jgi:mannose-1-phosphate guanylyltransferase